MFDRQLIFTALYDGTTLRIVRTSEVDFAVLYDGTEAVSDLYDVVDTVTECQQEADNGECIITFMSPYWKRFFANLKSAEVV